MPNAPTWPDANRVGTAALVPFGLSTWIRPAALSAANTSPFGATRMMRGASSPDANRLTSKPFGTIGFCSLVRCTIRTTFRADSAMSGAGKSCGLISRRIPGRSVRQSPNAAVPLSILVFGSAWRGGMNGTPVRIAIPATENAMMTAIELPIGRKANSSTAWYRLDEERAAPGGVPPTHCMCSGGGAH